MEFRKRKDNGRVFPVSNMLGTPSSSAPTLPISSSQVLSTEHPDVGTRRYDSSVVVPSTDYQNRETGTILNNFLQSKIQNQPSPKTSSTEDKRRAIVEKHDKLLSELDQINSTPTNTEQSPEVLSREERLALAGI